MSCLCLFDFFFAFCFSQILLETSVWYDNFFLSVNDDGVLYMLNWSSAWKTKDVSQKKRIWWMCAGNESTNTFTYMYFLEIYIFTFRMDSYITWKLAIYILRQSTTKYPVLYSVYAQLTWHLPFCKRYFSKLFPLIHSISGKSYIHKYTSNISIVKTLVSCSLQQYHLPVLC